MYVYDAYLSPRLHFSFFPLSSTDLLICTVSVSVSSSRYSRATCLPFSSLDNGSLALLCQDALFFQSAIAMTELSFQTMRGLDGNNSYRTRLQVFKTISLLRQKLSLESITEKTWIQILYVIVNLASSARIFGDDEATMHHLDGMHTIVSLIGGITKVPSAKLLVEILRYVLARSTIIGNVRNRLLTFCPDAI